jgi:uncharacterized protein YjiS (DUF1127 family)
MNIETTATLLAHPEAPSHASWSDGLKTWLKSYRRYRAFKAARAELMVLDDRMLRDIGINRSEITSVLLDARGERTAPRQLPIQPL